MDDLEILLTNDDGVDSPGLTALYDALSTVGSVTVVAPVDDQSAVGRTISSAVSVTDHELGYAIGGTPADCVVAGLSSLVPETDIVVAGCNQGANLGSAVLSRSGTVSAAIEAAFFDVPAMATSLYIPVALYRDEEDTLDVPQFAAAVEATHYLAEQSIEAGVFEAVDFLNINAPIAEVCTDEMVVTRPSNVYRLHSELEGDTVTLQNDIWELMETDRAPDPVGTDREAVMNDKISVSPLTAPHATLNHDALDRLAESYSAEQPGRED